MEWFYTTGPSTIFQITNRNTKNKIKINLQHFISQMYKIIILLWVYKMMMVTLMVMLKILQTSFITVHFSIFKAY